MANVNGIQLTGSVATVSPSVSAVGSDTNLDLVLNAKGSGDVASTHDADFGGGYRQSFDGWYQDNVAASQSAVALTRISGPDFGDKLVLPRAGSLTGICAKASTAVTAGSATIEAYVGTNTTGLTCVLDVTNSTFKATTQAKDADTFAAGDELSLKITTSTNFAPTTLDLVATLEVET